MSNTMAPQTEKVRPAAAPRRAHKPKHAAYAIGDPIAGLRLAGAVANRERTRVHLVWDAPEAAGLTGQRIERAPRPTGPWRVAASPPMTRRSVELDIAHTTDWFRVGLERGSHITYGQPIRAQLVGRSPYQLGDRVVPFAPYHKAVVSAVVHAPAALRAPEVAPLVLLVHGNNGVCRAEGDVDYCEMTMVRDRTCPDGMRWTPNAQGMAWLADTLAAAGMVAVVIDANTTNCIPLPGTVQGRVTLMLEHLRQWRIWGTGGGRPFGPRWAGRVDLSKVAIVGHSNGAEAAALVPEMLGRSRWDATLKGVDVGAIVSVAASDSLLSVVDGPALLTVLGSCDQQVTFMDGKSIHDRSLPARRAPLAEALIIGANHNGFNSRWLMDEAMDSPSGSMETACPNAMKLPGEVQRRLLGLLASSFIDAVVRQDVQPEAFMRAEAPTPSAFEAYLEQKVEMRWSYADPIRQVIDPFDGRDPKMRNALGGQNRFVGFKLAARCFARDCDGEFDHPVWALRLEWQQADARAIFPLGNFDASSFSVLSFRASQCLHGEHNRADHDRDLLIRLVDAAGNEATMRLSEAGRLRFPSTLARPKPKLPYMREQLHTVRMPLAAFKSRNDRLDLTRLTTISLETAVPGHHRGAIVLSQLELSR